MGHSAAKSIPSDYAGGGGDDVGLIVAVQQLAELRIRLRSTTLARTRIEPSRSETRPGRSQTPTSRALQSCTARLRVTAGRALPVP